VTTGQQNDNVRVEYRRLSWILIAGAAFWLVLIVRLVQVQGLQHAEYALRAKEQHLRRIELKATRGGILDRNGRELAMDIQAVTFYANPSMVERPEEVAKYFASVGSQSFKTLVGQLNSSRRFVYLARQVAEENLQEQVRSQNFSGVFEYPETKRYYPYGSLAGQLLGHTDIDHNGSEGIEGAFENLLGGINGLALTYVDSRGRQVPGMRQEHRPPQDGRSLYLTIDAMFQTILEEELERAIEKSAAESGMGIISDPRSGEILALANVPQYNPNNPGSTPATLRRNRVITDPFEPGSTFKVVAASAVLEDGLADTSDSVFCGLGRLVLENGDVIRDVHPYGTLKFSEVLAKSSNIGTIKLGKRISSNRFYEYIRCFGFGTRSGIDLPAESPGLFKPLRKWSSRSHETITIGQEISVTALQLAQAFGSIANGGTLMAPRVVKAVVGPDGRLEEEKPPLPIRRVMSPATASTLRRILAGVVEGGTGRRAHIEGFAIGGKTGTAQQVAKNGKGYDPNSNLVSFVGFLPADNPEMLCLIAVTNPRKGRWGGAIAAPAFKRVVERVFNLSEGVEPQYFAADDGTMAISVPDLRGMRPSAARFQADLRGASISFSGQGEVVVEQKPAPGSTNEDGGHIFCVLGPVEQSPSLGREIASLRQALLLQNLR
jgi:cell division protein FtsI/penicillin-binding protein 2